VLKGKETQYRFSTTQLPRQQMSPDVPLQLICWACKGFVTATPTLQTEIYLLEGCNTSQYEVYVSNLKEFAIFVSQLPFTGTPESSGCCVSVFILRNKRIIRKSCG
jgi:hypothetical protein